MPFAKQLQPGSYFRNELLASPIVSSVTQGHHDLVRIAVLGAVLGAVKPKEHNRPFRWTQLCVQLEELFGMAPSSCESKRRTISCFSFAQLLLSAKARLCLSFTHQMVLEHRPLAKHVRRFRALRRRRQPHASVLLQSCRCLYSPSCSRSVPHCLSPRLLTFPAFKKFVKKGACMSAVCV
jgi:hypothetical protein